MRRQYTEVFSDALKQVGAKRGSGGGQGGGMKDEDKKRAWDFIIQVLDRMMPPGSTDLPKNPPFKDGKPTFDTGGLDKEGLMYLQKA